MRLHFSSWVSMHAWLFTKFRFGKIQKARNMILQEYDLEYVIQYHARLFPLVKKEILINEAIAYFLIIEKMIDRYKIDAIISSGDSRMVNRVLKELAVKKRKKIFYFEQGPFGTTILDTKGVNANCSFRFSSEVSTSLNHTSLKAENTQKFRRNPLYRGLDKFFQIILYPFNLYPPDIYELKPQKTTKNNRPKQENTKWSSGYILLILQVPFDANMVLHSPLFNSSTDILKQIVELVPNQVIVVREHPLFKNMYENELYETIDQFENIRIDTNNLKNSIKNSKMVVVNNSTVGIEVVKFKKKVIVLGDSYYDQLKEVVKINNIEELRYHLNNPLEIYSNSHMDLEKLCLHFLPGHFRNKDLSFTKNIVKFLIND